MPAKVCQTNPPQEPGFERSASSRGEPPLCAPMPANATGLPTQEQELLATLRSGLTIKNFQFFSSAVASSQSAPATNASQMDELQSMAKQSLARKNRQLFEMSGQQPQGLQPRADPRAPGANGSGQMGAAGLAPSDAAPSVGEQPSPSHTVPPAVMQVSPAEHFFRPPSDPASAGGTPPSAVAQPPPPSEAGAVPMDAPPLGTGPPRTDPHRSFPELSHANPDAGASTMDVSGPYDTVTSLAMTDHSPYDAKPCPMGIEWIPAPVVLQPRIPPLQVSAGNNAGEVSKSPATPVYCKGRPLIDAVCGVRSSRS